MCQPPCEAVSWNNFLPVVYINISRQPPCEAVSWNKLNVLCSVRWTVSLLVRLWVEISIHQFIAYAISRQPPCEAVSWNVLSDCVLLLLLSSASLWGCELKCVCVSSSECFFQSASLWGCELKYRSLQQQRTWKESASLWGCELKCGSYAIGLCGLPVSLLVRLWVEIHLRRHNLLWFCCRPPCEAVSWNKLNVLCSVRWTVSLLVRLWVEIQLSSKHLKFAWVSLLVRLWVEIPYWSGWNDNVLVSLLVRLWVEIRNRKRPTSQMWSASLWGCELKCRVPRIWLFHCNRQIILRSGIKSLQPFERWSNLLQVTCDLW